MVAWWLLLLLGRILTPEAAVLRLHGHTHTTVEPAQTAANKASGNAFLTTRHQHCDVEHFYNAPLQVVDTLGVAPPRYAAVYLAHRLLATVGCLTGAWQQPALRGPPAC